MRKLARRISSWFLNLKFQKKLVISYMAVIIVPMLILSVFSYVRNMDILEQQLSSTMQNSHEQICENINNSMKNTNQFIRFITFSPYLVEELENESFGTYKFTKKLNSYFEPLIWYNLSINRDLKELQIYADSLTNSTGYFFLGSAEVKDTEWYKLASNAEDTAWYFEDSELYGVRRMFDSSQNEVIGVLKFRMNTEYVMENIMLPSEDSTGFIIFDSNNEMLYSYQNDDRTDSLELSRKLRGNGSSIKEIGDYYCMYDSFNGTDWKLFYYSTVNDYFSKMTENFWFTIAILTACACVLSGIVILFSRYFVKRINCLNEKMNEVEQGNLAVSIEADSGDEIGRLYGSFDLMLQQINKLIGKVHEEEGMIREAELKQLQSLINPHFLYNALSLINWNALDSGNENIAFITQQLAAFYRTCLNKGNNMTTIEREVSNIKAYIEIQLIMHDGSFEVSYEIDEALNGQPVVNFIMQPLVENAVIHGLDEKEEGERRLDIKVCRREEGIQLTVQDNGVGMEQEQADRLTTMESKGYGIKNVNDRICLCYGINYGVRIKSERGKGTVAVITLPVS